MISRKAQIVAMMFFEQPKAFVHFMTPSRITPDTRVALEEMAAAGMIVVDVMADNTVMITATDKIGAPRDDYSPFNAETDEQFVMLYPKEEA